MWRKALRSRHLLPGALVLTVTFGGFLASRRTPRPTDRARRQARRRQRPPARRRQCCRRRSHRRPRRPHRRPRRPHREAGRQRQRRSAARPRWTRSRSRLLPTRDPPTTRQQSSATASASPRTATRTGSATWTDPTSCKTGRGPLRANCSSCHGRRPGRARRAADLQRPRARPRSTSGSPPAGCRPPTRGRPGDPQAAALRPDPGARDRRLRQLADPGRAPRSRIVNTRPRDLEHGASFSPSTAPPATPSPGPVTPWPTPPSPRASTWPHRPSRVEAIRTGPGNMPRFAGNLTDTQVARHRRLRDRSTSSTRTTPAASASAGSGPVAEGFVGLLFGVGGLMLVCFWIGDRT